MLTLQEMAKRGCLFLSNEKCMKIALFLFSLKLKTSFFWSAWLFFYKFQGPKLECCKLPKSSKSTRKNKAHYMLWTLCYRHYITDITLQTLYYGHYDCITLIMVILLGEINATCIPILFKFITSKFSVFLTKH